jgi:hypothetical protein
MRDQLEDFIKNNKAGFDNKAVPESTWRSIQQGIETKTAWLNPLRYWQAAAILFFGLSTYFWIQQSPAIVGQSRVNKEFADAEAFYTQQISEKVSMINASSENAEVFTRDFQQLEAMYEMLKEELKQHPSDKVRDAIILNLLVQINLLNLQLKQADETKKEQQKSASI